MQKSGGMKDLYKFLRGTAFVDDHHQRALDRCLESRRQSREAAARFHERAKEIRSLANEQQTIGGEQRYIADFFEQTIVIADLAGKNRRFEYTDLFAQTVAQALKHPFHLRRIRAGNHNDTGALYIEPVQVLEKFFVIRDFHERAGHQGADLRSFSTTQKCRASQLSRAN